MQDGQGLIWGQELDVTKATACDDDGETDERQKRPFW